MSSSNLNGRNGLVFFLSNNGVVVMMQQLDLEWGLPILVFFSKKWFFVC
jgi:hypothetical protein